MRNKSKKNAFTLIELLVVIAVISMLMSIILPSMKKAREQGKRVVCLTNLRAIGEGIYVYAHDNDDLLIPGDSWEPWEVHGVVMEYNTALVPQDLEYRQVNLGHLLAPQEILPIPTNKKHVFFCPSHKTTDGRPIYEMFEGGWKSRNSQISYMFNTALDGFDGHVQSAEWPSLPHKDKIQFLMVDGSAHAFNLKPLIYEPGFGPEMLQDVSVRYNVSFPQVMLHEWLARGEINLTEAQTFLANPQGWTDANKTLFNDLTCDRSTAEPVRLASISNKSIVCDAVVQGITIVPT
jgi:prepilin-type N-terminal cleavage/methylation domain-containing protein